MGFLEAQVMVTELRGTELMILLVPSCLCIAGNVDNYC